MTTAKNLPLEASVIIAFKGPISTLIQQVNALLNQDVAPDIFEVLICDNDPSIDTQDLQATILDSIRRDENLSLRLKVLDARSKIGPSFARNVGAFYSNSKYLLFCDSDDVVSAHWVRKMISALDHSEAVGGKLEYNRLNGESGSTWNKNASDSLPIKFGHLPYAMTCNFGVSRNLFLEVGGFDEKLVTGEDADISWRVQYAGGSLVFAEDALVHYRTRNKLGEIYRQHLQFSSEDLLLLRKHEPFGAKYTLTELITETARFFAAMLKFWQKGGRARIAARLGILVGRISWKKL